MLIVVLIYVLTRRLPTRSTRTDTLLPNTTLVRSFRKRGVEACSVSGRFVLVGAGVSFRGVGALFGDFDALFHHPVWSPPKGLIEGYRAEMQKPFHRRSKAPGAHSSCLGHRGKQIGRASCRERVCQYV